MMPVGKEHVFEAGGQGKAFRLLEGIVQRIDYHAMLGPDWTAPITATLRQCKQMSSRVPDAGLRAFCFCSALCACLMAGRGDLRGDRQQHPVPPPRTVVHFAGQAP
jgi:predicted dithiol-disulfide oxidoreductase (DUF899 family)